MVTTYEPKNPYVRGSKRSTNVTMGICFNYLCHIPAKEIANGLKTTEPTVHRMIRRFQDRLASDTNLLAMLCGLLVEGEEFLEPHASLIRWIAKAKPKEIEKFKRCVYDCLLANEMSSDVLRAYMFSGEVDFATDVHPLAASPSTTFHFRDKFCRECQAIERRCQDPMIINGMSAEEILAVSYRRNFARHLPAMIVRSCAKWRVVKELEDDPGFGPDMEYSADDRVALRDKFIRIWFDSALPYLRMKPL